MALNLRTPQSERYVIEPEEPIAGPRLGSALSDWDREDASRNPAGMADDPDQPAIGWQRWMRAGFGLLALAGFAGVLWYAYEWGLGGGESVELPTVKAEAGPEKVKPSDPGGLQVPYQDQLVLNQEGAEDTSPRVERLLPPPETPLPPALTDIAPSYDEVPTATEGESGTASGEVATLQPAGEPSTTKAGPEAAAVETVPALPAAPSAQAGTNESAAPPSTASETATTKSSTTKSSTTKSTATQATGTQTAEAQPATTAAADADGQFAVQLVSLKDAGAAKKEWSRLQGVFPGLLGDKALLLQTAEVAGVGKVYRLRAGPFATRAKAARVCAELKSKQQDCLVVNR